MRKLIILAGLLVAAGVAIADPIYVPLEVNITNTTLTFTDTQNPRGYVDEIIIQAPTKVCTGNVAIVTWPNVGTNMGWAATVIYTNAAVTNAVLARPRVAQQDNTGTNLSSLTVPERYLCNGDPIRLYVAEANNITDVVFKVWLKVDRK